MKTPLYAVLLAVVAAASAQDPAPVIAERGAHHRTWRQRVERTLPDGRAVQTVRSYTELGTGMHYWKDGQWLETQAAIELLADGAAALRGPHQVLFAPNMNTLDAIQLFTPDGKRLVSHVLGLFYRDAASGQYVLLAQVKDCTGELHPPNRIVYPDAFSDLEADIVLLYRQDGLEQNIVLRQAPPPPSAFGLNPDTTRLEAWTEFVGPPSPARTTQTLAEGRGGQEEAVSPFTDEFLDFGAMKIGPGTAFIEGPDSEAADLAGNALPVGKTWTQIDGRTVLIEAVQYPRLKEQLDSARLHSALPARNRLPSLDPARIVPVPLQARARDAKQKIKLARKPSAPALAGLARPRGVVIDYSIVASATSFTFRGDTTYLVTNSVTMQGSTVIEGGAVIKMVNPAAARITIYQGTLECRTSPQSPAIFTSKDDDSICEIIAGSTGTATNYAGLVGLYLHSPGSPYRLHDLRFSFLTWGVYGLSGVEIGLTNAQFLNVRYPVRAMDARFQGCNLLLRDCQCALYCSGATTNAIEHGTLHDVTNLVYVGGSTPSVSLVNTILAGVTTNVGCQTEAVVITNGSAAIFQTVGAGAHYLTDNSPLRDAGSTNISASLRAAFASMTTYPPTVLSNTLFTTSATLSPVTPRDTDTPDIGYHYMAVDLMACKVAATNQSTLTVSPGTVIGSFGENGLWLQDASRLVCVGSPRQRIQFLRYNAVQEHTDRWGEGLYPLPLCLYHASNAPPTCVFRFTDFNALSGAPYHLYATLDPCWTLASLAIQDCAFRGSLIYLEGAASMPFGLTNNLFFRPNFWLFGSALAAFNNLVWGAADWVLVPNETNDFVLRNNAFYGSSIPYLIDVVNSHNAYIQMPDSASRLFPTNPSDIVLPSFTFTKGPLGDYYQPTNSALLNTGSTNAHLLGLYHMTVLATQLRETNSMADRGLHYVAVDSNGQPVDTDGDGLPDYLEDINGNGSLDPSLIETDWQTYTTLTNNTPGLQVFTPLK